MLASFLYRVGTPKPDRAAIPLSPEADSPLAVFLWLDRARHTAIADVLGLSPEECRRWLSDPDEFLQSSVGSHGAEGEECDGIAWYEEPRMVHLLDDEWIRYLHLIFTAPRKAEAIVVAFAEHPAAGQFTFPVDVRSRLAHEGSRDASHSAPAAA